MARSGGMRLAPLASAPAFDRLTSKNAVKAASLTWLARLANQNDVQRAIAKSRRLHWNATGQGPQVRIKGGI